MDVTVDRSKVQSYKEQYCIRTWNIRMKNQSNFKVVKEEMVRISILGISEIKWMGKVKFN